MTGHHEEEQRTEQSETFPKEEESGQPQPQPTTTEGQDNDGTGTQGRPSDDSDPGHS